MSRGYENVGILAFVPDLWVGAPMSRHHILGGLSECYKVLWVSPPTYLDGWRRTGIRKALANRGFQAVSEALWTYASWLPADYKSNYTKGGVVARCFRLYHRLWQRAYVRKLRRLLRRMGIENVILYVWRPDFHWVLGLFEEVATCYHIVDEYSFNSKEETPISGEERKLLEASDAVFIHSKTLMDKKGHINPNTTYVPNGVDFKNYRSVIDAAPPEPEDLAVIPHPRIGYMGWIKRHIDLTLLRRIAEARPEWSLVLVGPVRLNHEDIREDVVALRALSNVYFLHEKPAHELPRFINGFDVALMPYRKTPYTRYIYPLKMHEYLACGKPVVATKLENLEEFRDVLKFAEDVSDWIEKIESSLIEGRRGEEQRVKVASRNSWGKRVSQVREVLDKIVGEPIE